MEVNVALQRRHSCRSFRSEKVPKSLIKRLTVAFSQAPYASGGPRRRLYIVDKPESLMELQVACCHQSHVGSCTAAFIICGEDTNVSLRSGHSKYVFDCVASAMCIDLMATSYDLGICWIGNFHPEKVAKFIKYDLKPVIILVVGNPE